MRLISWDSFDGHSFQKLCNALLLFDVSRFAHVFSDKGADGGVDQSYQGSHNGRTGKWRFQDKFHNSGNKTRDRGAFSRDIKQDLRENYQGENFLVFMTNVTLNDRKQKEMEALAAETMRELNIAGCEVLIWHGGVIEGLIAHYPVIYNWFWEKDSVLLQPYDEYFARQLNDPADRFRNQFGNPFFGREQEMEQMRFFLVNPAVSTLALVANGGYGKTRLCIEFIKTMVDEEDEWIALVLSHTGFNAAHCKQLLTGNRRLLILIDNANEVPEIVKDMKQLVDATRGRHKLMLTTRPALFADIQNRIPSHSNDLEKLELKKLSYDQTTAMLADAMPGLNSRHIIHLAGISKGVPNVLLELVRLIMAGKQPHELTSDQVFTDNVMEIFRQAVRDITARTMISGDKILDFLKLVSLISPVTHNNHALAFIAGIIGVRQDQLDLIITSLAEMNLLETNASFAIKPDPYSDALLAETIRKNKAFVEHIRQSEGAETYFENILKNLSEAEVGDEDKKSFIDSLLTGYVALLHDPALPGSKIKNIFSFVASIAMSKPQIALRMIETFMDWKENEAHAVHTTPNPLSTKSLIDELQQFCFDALKSLCVYADYQRDHKQQMHGFIERFARLTGDYSIILASYGYREWDFSSRGYHVQECSERQLFLKNIICPYLQNASPTEFQLQFGLVAAQMLLSQEFKLEQFYDPVKMTFHFGTSYVHDCTHIREIRMDTIGALISLMRSDSDAVHKDKAADLLLDDIFFCTTASGRRGPLDLTNEVKIVLDFLLQTLNEDPTTALKNKIRAKIQIFEKGEYKDSYRELLMEIKAKAIAPKDMRQELELNLINDDYFDNREHLEGRIMQLIPKYPTFDAFRNELMKLTIAHERTNCQTILAIIAKRMPEKAKDLFSFIKQQYPTYIGPGLELVRHVYKERDYFYSVVDWLWQNRDKNNNLYLTFWLLTYGRGMDRTAYEKEDLTYFAHLIDQKKEDHQLNQMVGFTLADYAYVDREETFRLLSRFLGHASVSEAGSLQYVLFDEQQSYKTDFTEELKKLFYDHPLAIDVEHAQSNPFMHFLEKNYGFNELFDFVVNWFKTATAKDEHRYFHFDRKYYHSKDATKEEATNRFVYVLRWFISETKAGIDRNRQAESILALFRPDHSLLPDTTVALTGLMNELATDMAALKAMAIGIRQFNRDTLDWVLLMSAITETAMELEGEKINAADFFGNAFLYNSGSKSKVGKGVPYAEDAAKKEMLDKILQEHTFIPVVKTYLEASLRQVNQAIERELRDDERETGW